MEDWAKAFPQVQFLCVCVDKPGVAIQFGMMFQLDAAVNCWIPSRGYMPVGYGQLGCSGFIVVDPKGNFISRKTMSFLDYGEDAYADVERLLAPYISKPSVTQPQVVVCKPAATTVTVCAPAATKVTPCAPAATTVKACAPAGKPDPPKATLPSVGVHAMDAEHESCSEALERLLKDPTTKNLKRLVNELEEHFEHEEELMKEHGFGGAQDGGSFSAFASHVADHQRILDIARQELKSKTKTTLCLSESTN